MTREELIEELARLADRANLSEDTKPASAILYTVLGALVGRQDRELMAMCSEFSQHAIRGLRAREN